MIRNGESCMLYSWYDALTYRSSYNSMRTYTPQEIEALTNWDNLLCKPPHRNVVEKRQYYSRYISRMLWRYFDDHDWQEIAMIIDDLRVSPKLKKTTQFLLSRHVGLPPRD